MKRMFIVLIAFIIVSISASCVNENSNGSNTKIPDSINNKSKDIINFYGVDIQEGTEMNTFKKLIKEEFGIELNIYNTRYSFKSGISVSDLNGFLLYYGSPMDGVNYRNEYFQEISQYLYNNQTFSILPETLKNSIKDSNGDIWYLPLGHLFSLKRRIYADSSMEMNNYQVPETLDELVSLLLQVKKDFSETTDFKVMYVDKHSCILQMKDIIEANSMTVYSPNSSTIGIIGWNEKTNRFEDTFSTENISSFLYTIHYLAGNHVIDTINTVSAPVDILWKERQAGKLFTSIGNTNKNFKYSSGSLQDSGVEYIYNHQEQHLYVPKGMENAEEALNLFINTFFGSNRGNIMGTYGESGRFITYDETFRFVNNLPQYEWIQNPENNTVYRIGLVEKWFNIDYAISSPKLSPEENEENYKAKREFQQELDRKFESGEIVVLSPEKILGLTSHDRNLSRVNDIFSNMLFGFIEGNINVTDFADQYIKDMKIVGTEKYINGLNSKIPGAPIFSYDIN